ncbi:hypothetical protein chiPu_0027072 [Chiloscyllium punctatum]|uniref:MHC class I-like antigen recognition-like domain-containing protein n=1 Tax=Chiloscyllium punctatum TaxID=137246 RepID=A0A401TK46_CHIPU|nr:hypothetical protein [Chiloscyllium punctatum]
MIVGYVDGVQFVKYNSGRKELIPREQWMVEGEGQDAWEWKTMLAQEQELYFQTDIPKLMYRTNQTGGESLMGLALKEWGETRTGLGSGSQTLVAMG